MSRSSFPPGNRRGLVLLSLSAGLALLFVCTLVVPSTEVRPHATDYLVGAYYYPWYVKERWTRELVAHTAKLGRYESADRTVTARHVAWARQADLDFFLVSWLSPDGYEARNLRQAVLPEVEKADFRFALLYETPLALQMTPGQPLDLERRFPDGSTAGDRMVAHFEHLADTYLTHRCYLRYHGRPVVMVYLVRDMVQAGPYLETVRERLKRRGVELYLIADVVYWEPPEKLDWKFLGKHFEAITGYNMYPHDRFLQAVEGQFEETARAAREAGLGFIPNVMPGYDDRNLRGHDRLALARAGGKFYRDYWELASRYVDRKQPFLLITSFNEWHEGTELEPSAEYGEEYLRLTRELIAELRRR